MTPAAGEWTLALETSGIACGPHARAEAKRDDDARGGETRAAGTRGVDAAHARGAGAALLRGHRVCGTTTPAGGTTPTAGLLDAVRRLMSQHGCRPRDVSAVCFSAGPGSFTGLRVAATIARMLAATVGCRVASVPTLEAIAANVLAESAGLGAARGADASPARRHVAVMLDARGGRVCAAGYVVAPGFEVRELVTPSIRPVEEWLAVLAARDVQSDEPDANGRLRTKGPRAAAASTGEAERADVPSSDARAQTGADTLRPWLFVGDGAGLHERACRALGVVADPELWTPRVDVVAALGRRRVLRADTIPIEQISPLYLRPPECEEVYERRRAEARARRARGT